MADNDGLKAELVPQDCKGIWNASLPPNDYYLNRDAYDVTLVSTRVTTLEFKGGFSRRYIDLKVDSKGDFTQTERTQNFAKPEDAADAKTAHGGIETACFGVAGPVVDDTVKVTNVQGRSRTCSGTPFPPARPHSSRCHASPLYSREQDGHTAARRLPQRT